MIVAIIIISALAILLIYEKPQGITAMEAVELSNVPAKEWNENAELISMGITDYTFFTENSTSPQSGSNGLYNEWFCTYAVLHNGNTNASSISFKVCANGTVIEQNRVENSLIFELGVEFITNWTIDSNEAYDIALNNSRVQDWLEQHPDSYLLYFNINKMDLTMWHISWIDKSESNRGFLSVGIVADTGEIIVSES